MQVAEAKALITDLPVQGHAQRWLDLGAGGGTFTLALAELLPEGSSIEAWDLHAFALRHIPSLHGGVRIATRQADMLRTQLPRGIDGVFMANAIHYVKDQATFLDRIRDALTDGGVLLLAEYDTDEPVATWVPYPISFDRLTALLPAAGFSAPERLGSRPSAYGRGDLYTAFAHRNPTSNPR